MAGKFDPSLFFQQAGNVALRVPPSELFSLIKRSIDLPGQWAALVSRPSGERTVIQAGGILESGDIEDVLFVRTTPVAVTLEEEVTSRDGYACQVTVTFKMRLILERGDLVSFENEVLGSHRVVQADGVARYVHPDVRDALLTLARQHEASDLVGAVDADAVETALKRALVEPGFRAGLALEGPPNARFRSESFSRVSEARQEVDSKRALVDTRRELDAALEQAQQQHVDHLADMLSRLKTLAADSPDVALPDLVKTFTESQRGEIYEALFACEPVSTPTRWIVVAAGDELFFYDPRHTDRSARRFDALGAAGPVRSIQAQTLRDGSVVLWLGAATGVYRWPLDASTSDLTLAIDPAPEVRGGFNAVAVAGNRVYASHSEIGLCAWSLEDPDRVKRLFEDRTRGAKAVRGVLEFEGDLFCAIDNRVVRWPEDTMPDCPAAIYTGSVGTLSALCATSGGVYAGNADGDVLYWPTDRETSPERVHTGLGRAVESVRLLRSHGVERLVYADTSLHIHAKVIGDAFACRYEAGGQTLRRVEVADDLLVATNDLRDRLILWKPSAPTTPCVTIPVARQTGRSVQDVCLVAAS